MWSGSRVVIGVSGSIAAYKAADLASKLVQGGAVVDVILTRAAEAFITPLTFEALTGRPVARDPFPALSTDPASASSTALVSVPSTPSTPVGPELALEQHDQRALDQFDHLTLARRALLVIVAPATADLIGRMAAGIADSVLLGVLLATRAPVLVAPAMNPRMWDHPAVQRNVRELGGFGYHLVGPEYGRMACGDSGLGRMASIEAILEAGGRLLGRGGAAEREGAGARHEDRSETSDTSGLAPEPEGIRDLFGRTILVSAGPTREPLDPVRFLSNRSSGKMGYAVASRAAARGARTILVSGPVSIPAPPGCELVKVETAKEMHREVLGRVGTVDVVIMAAAVADYRPEHALGFKIKKERKSRFELVLAANPDILADLGSRGERPLLVGFAAETDHLETHARRKLEEKNLDLIVGNDVGQDRGVFGSDSNTVLILDRHGGRTQLPLLPKEEVAERILDQVAALLSGRPSLAAAGPMVQPREPQASLPADSLPENGG